VRLTFDRAVGGRIRHGHCVQAVPRRKDGRRCQLLAPRGGLGLSVAAGARRVRFDGRLAHHTALPPGAYTLVLIAEKAGARSSPRRLNFTILK